MSSRQKFQTTVQMNTNWYWIVTTSSSAKIGTFRLVFLIDCSEILFTYFQPFHTTFLQKINVKNNLKNT